MTRLLFTLALLLMTPWAAAAGPTENATSRHAKAYGSDEKWWKCNATEPAKGCDTGTFDALGLSKDEQAFVKNRLDQIAWRPKKTDKEVVAKLLGAKPAVDVGMKQSYVGVGPGSDPNRGVSVYYYEGSAYMVHWFQPGRFMLIRASSF